MLQFDTSSILLSLSSSSPSSRLCLSFVSPSSLLRTAQKDSRVFLSGFNRFNKLGLILIFFLFHRE
ncbi:hypothetical protein LguiA_020287 [Lonicera macranthoides]